MLVEGRELGKRLLALLVGTALVLGALATEARAQDLSLESGAFFSPVRDMEESVLDDLYIQGEVIEETHTRRVVGESQPPDDREYVERTQSRRVVGQHNPRYNPEMPAQWSLRVGWLWVASAEDEKPTNVPSIGLSVRVLLPPEGLHMIELSFDSSIDRMELDETPGVMEAFYQEYYDIVVSFIGSFGARQGIESPLYWGVGIGYSKETARVNYLDAARTLGYPGADRAFNESGVFQLKLGWDSGRNTYVELIYKKLMDSDRNLDQLFNLVVGIYF